MFYLTNFIDCCKYLRFLNFDGCNTFQTSWDGAMNDWESD